jgi:hypothetical protein
MHWSVEEQTIPVTAVKAPVQSITLRVDPSSSQYALMELHCGSDEESYVLRFNRNGTLDAVATIPPPEAPKSEASHADTHPSKGKK